MTPEVPPTAPPPPFLEDLYLAERRTPVESLGPRGDQYNTGESERPKFTGFYWAFSVVKLEIQNSTFQTDILITVEEKLKQN